MTARGELVYLVSCASKKLDKPAPARDLYSSQLFRKSLAYAELRAPGRVYIASALHYLVQLDSEIAPYNLDLASLSKDRRYWWGVHVLQSIAKLHSAPQLVLLAGATYAGPLVAAARHQSWPMPQQPLHGMQIGQRLSWLRERIAESTPTTKTDSVAPVVDNPTIHPTRFAELTEPYVHQHQGPLGWVVELRDPRLPSDRQLVRTERPLKRFTRADKDRMIRLYKYQRARQGGDDGDQHDDAR